MKIVTFNLRCWWAEEDGINNFLHRLGLISERIHQDLPDVIGFQEVGARQYVYLERLLPEYTLVGQLRNADFTGEGLYVAARKETMQVLAHNTFWLSPAPYEPGSRFEEQSDCPRICNAVRLRHRESGTIFRVFNLHLDHVGEDARQKGMGCVLEEVTRLNRQSQFPSVILGDFNSKPGSEAINMCKRYQPYPVEDVTANINHTFHAYGTVENTKIDFIFMTKEFSSNVSATGIWDDKVHGIYLSDHYPVWADVDV